MNQSNLKNMIVLKNIPSNLVEEAIIILKSNKRIKKLEKIENSKSIDNTTNKKKEKDYLVKEAEMVISNYILELEHKKNEKKYNNKKLDKKYKKLKRYAYIATFIIIIQMLSLLIK